MPRTVKSEQEQEQDPIDQEVDDIIQSGVTVKVPTQKGDPKHGAVVKAKSGSRYFDNYLRSLSPTMVARVHSRMLEMKRAHRSVDDWKIALLLIFGVAAMTYLIL